MKIISLKHLRKRPRADAGAMESFMESTGKGAHGAPGVSSTVPHSWTVSASNPLLLWGGFRLHVPPMSAPLPSALPKKIRKTRETQQTSQMDGWIERERDRETDKNVRPSLSAIVDPNRNRGLLVKERMWELLNTSLNLHPAKAQTCWRKINKT